MAQDFYQLERNGQLTKASQDFIDKKTANLMKISPKLGKEKATGLVMRKLYGDDYQE